MTEKPSNCALVKYRNYYSTRAVRAAMLPVYLALEAYKLKELASEPVREKIKRIRKAVLEHKPSLR